MGEEVQFGEDRGRGKSKGACWLNSIGSQSPTPKSKKKKNLNFCNFLSLTSPFHFSFSPYKIHDTVRCCHHTLVCFATVLRQI
jgi:hypothetical protein